MLLLIDYITEKRLQEEHQLLMPLKNSMPDSFYFGLMAFHPIIAGGAVRSVFTDKKIADYDFYFNSINQFASITKFIEYMVESEKDECTRIISTINSDTYNIYGNTIQLVKKYIDLTIIGKLNKFDFTVCQGAFDCSTKEFTYSKNFIIHNAKNRLVYTQNTDYPLSTVIRVLKYLNKGYNISNTEYLKILLDVQNLKFDTFRDFKEHVLGIDVVFLMPLFELFEKKYNLNNNFISIDDMPYNKDMAIKLIEFFIEYSKTAELKDDSITLSLPTDDILSERISDILTKKFESGEYLC